MTVRNAVLAFMIASNLVGYQLIVVSISLLGLETTPFAIGLRAAAGGAAGVCFVLGLFTRPQMRFGIVLLGLCLLLYALRLIHETTYEDYLLGQEPFYYWGYFLGTVVAPFVAIAVASAFDWRPAYLVLLIAGTLAVGLILMVGSTEVATSSVTSVDTGRLALEALNPISVGTLGASITLAAAWYAISDARAVGSLRVVAAAAALLGLVLMLASSSRGPVIGLIVGLAVLFLANRGTARLWFVVFTLVALVPGALFFTQGSALVERFDALMQGGDLSASIRVAIYREAAAMILDHPLSGSAIEVATYRYYPHNAILEFAMATGLVGGALFLFAMLHAAVRTIVLVRERHAAAPFGLLFVQALVGSQFSGALFANAHLWITAAIVCVATPTSVFASRSGRARSARPTELAAEGAA